MVLVLNFLNALGTDGSLSQSNSQTSVLSEIGRQLTPLFKPMGIQEHNWPATVGIFTGILAKEAVVGTLNTLYSQQALTASTPTEPARALYDTLNAAFATIPANLAQIAARALDPLGLDISVATAENDVNSSTYAAMQGSFDGKSGAFAYLLFILLYAPCTAATAAIFKETNLNWTLFVVAWTTGLGYLIATVFYQIMTFSQHPSYSLYWINSLLLGFSVVLAGLWFTGKTNQNQPPAPSLN